MKKYIGSDEHFIDSVNARHEQKEQDDKKMKEEIDKQINSQEFEQCVKYELEQKLSACEIVLEQTQEDFNKVLKLLKSMTLSMAAHPDCFKRPDGSASEFYDLVEMAEKVLEGTLDTRHG